MQACASCKNKNSNERCKNNALHGIIFCGKHSRSKNPRIWSIINNVDKNVILISKIWRGYIIRKLLRLAGPGVLKRQLCTNKEELNTLDPINSVDPFDYFGFEEKDKVYGFNMRSLFDNYYRNFIITNPYTRQPLTIETRRRLRELFGYRLRHKLPRFYDNNSLNNVTIVLNNSWFQLCQIIEENGFIDTGVHPNLFLGLNKSQLYILINFILTDLRSAWLNESKNINSLKFKFLFLLQNTKNKFSTSNSVEEYSFYVSSGLLSVLYSCTDPYTVCFIIMAALYRL